MPDIKLTCPNCLEDFAFRYELTEFGSKAPNGQITPLTSSALEDVYNTLVHFGPGSRVPTFDLFGQYQRVAYSAGRPIDAILTKYAFIAGLRRYGCERWRTAHERGYTLPDPLPAGPVQIAAKAKERRDAELQRQFERPSAPVVSDKPVERFVLPPGVEDPLLFLSQQPKN